MVRVWPFGLTLLLLLSAASGCGSANLWPPGTETRSEAETEGQRWLKLAYEAHGGRALVRGAPVSVWLRDRWPNWFFRVLAMPWPENNQRMRHDVRALTDDLRLTFVGGPKDGTGWGIQSWVTYQFGPEGLDFDPVDQPNETIKFWLPTNVYFLFLPWRIQEASFVQDLGAVEIEGRGYRQVFATWGEGPVQAGVDQYVLYIDAETHLLGYVRYTVKDMGDSFEGLLAYRDIRQVGPLRLAYQMDIIDEYADPSPTLHGYLVEKVELAPDLETGWLKPRPDLRATK